MESSKIVFLLNDQVRAMACTYEEDGPGAMAKRTNFKTMDETIKAGDFVVVPTTTRHKMTVVKVVETDIDLDFDDPVKIDWIIDVLDLGPHKEMLAKEAEAINAANAAEKRRKREELRASMIANHGEMFKTLQLTTVPIDDKPAE